MTDTRVAYDKQYPRSRLRAISTTFAIALTLTLAPALTPALQGQVATPVDAGSPALERLLDSNSSQPSPESFLKTVYSLMGDPATNATFIGGVGASHIYGGQLFSSLRKGYRRSSSFVTMVDFNPLCTCQSTETVTLTGLSFSQTGDKQMDAAVTLHLLHGQGAADAEPTWQDAPQPPATDGASPPAPPKGQQRTLVLHMVKTSKGWRVDDITTREVHSYKLLLRNPAP